MSASTSECTLEFFTLLNAKGKKELIEWCMSEGLIASNYECPVCKEQMKLSENKKIILDGYNWRCRKYGVNAHEVSRSIRNNSWFSNSKISMYDILRLTRMWFGRCMNDYVVNELKINKNTVVDWFMFCREVCMSAIVNESAKIGGENVIVEIEEKKHGKDVNERWVIGGIERGTNRCFFRMVPRRTKGELLLVIREWVLPGSTIVSDCWSAYNCLSDEDFENLRVYHNVSFKNPCTSSETNSIEGTWSAIKRFLKNRTNHTPGIFDRYLAEYMWRRSHDNSLGDEAFKAFLKAVIALYPPLEKDQKKARNKMSDRSMDAKHIANSATCILLDIEGTTTSIDFVRKDLLKYVIQNIQNYVIKHWNDTEVKNVVKELIIINNDERSTSTCDGENSDVSRIQEDFINKLKTEIQSSQKSTAIKELEALVWMDGCIKGELIGHLYPDVVDAFKVWKSQKKDIYVYSNGSVQSQHILFGQSVYGDLRNYIAGNFDTNIGSKLDEVSYSKICQTIGKSPNEVIFFSDHPKELLAAKEAGLKIVLVIRNPECLTFPEEMNCLVPTDPTINSFLEVVNNAEDEK